ncbi:MAG: hypothetical protein CVU48_08625 [Candidatus Cloacimonetes bacterium HGW-Cloacimonetes-1]|jgi:8-oxo-dGTP pyrophosphatase MutT (NUDIX family)|nr:MAG: hypothetical protein CVU48_08625 [Candidatus Cloacimonetes bacterium HGW-Cloacimonetes-1]
MPASYRIIYETLLSPQDIEFELIPNKKTYPREIKELISAAWNMAKLDPELNLFNGKVLAYLGSTPQMMPEGTTKLRLQVQETDYKSFFGTNVKNAHQIYESEQLANALAVCAVVETLDATIVIGNRSKAVAEGSELWHVPGGTIEIPKLADVDAEILHKLGLPHCIKSAFNPFYVMIKELSEELNIGLDDYLSLACLGLGENLEMKKPEFLCHFRLRLTAAEVRSRMVDAIDAAEHSQILFVPIEDCQDFVQTHPFTPIGTAAIELYMNTLGLR